MTPLQCHHCGAPLGPPEPGTHYVTCVYCKTTTALPLPPPPQAPREPEPRPQATEVRVSLVSANDVRRVRKMVGFTLSSGLFIVLLMGAVPLVTALRNSDLVTSLRTQTQALPAFTSSFAPKLPAVPEPTLASASTSLPAPPKKASPRPAKAGSLLPASKGASASAAPPTPSATPPRPRVIKVAIGSVKVTRGSYPTDVIKSKLNTQQPSLRGCYEALLDDEPGAAGKLQMSFQIDKEGQPRGVGARSPELSVAVVPCVNRALARIKYPPPEQGSAQVEFVLRFSFEGGDPTQLPPL